MTSQLRQKWWVGASQAKRTGRENCLFKGPRTGRTLRDWGKFSMAWSVSGRRGGWCPKMNRSYLMEDSVRHGKESWKPLKCFKIVIRFLGAALPQWGDPERPWGGWHCWGLHLDFYNQVQNFWPGKYIFLKTGNWRNDRSIYEWS